MKSLFAALFVLVTATPITANASRIVMVNEHPTKIISSTWHEYVTSDGGVYNGNLWTNVWPADGKLGGYGYLQVAERYTQVYGGVALRNGPIEFGAGLGVENADGDVGARQSIYGILTRGDFQSATWYEHSEGGGSWFLSNNLYGFKPGRFEAGLRFQRFLGGGPMTRLTFPSVGRVQPQVYGAALYDGDGFNPIVGLNVNF